jgi:hypothetical protein
MTREEPIGEQLIVRLYSEALDTLKEIACLRGVDLQQALEEALGYDLFILKAAANGSRILVKNPDRSIEELLLAAGD